MHPIAAIASRQSNVIQFKKAALRAMTARTHAELIAALKDADAALAEYRDEAAIRRAEVEAFVDSLTVSERTRNELIETLL
jgi:hypothetical protein